MKYLIAVVLVAGILLGVNLGLPALSPQVSAQTTSQPPQDSATSLTQGAVACGIELQVGTNCTINAAQGEDKVLGIIREIINVMSLIVGAICVLMIIFGGFRYMISGGESAGVTSAKNTILYAVVGLVVVLLAQALVRFVFARATSV